MNQNYTANLQSLDIFDKYISILQNGMDESYSYLLKLDNHDRSLNENHEWDDRNHYEFSEDCLIAIHKGINASINAHKEAIERLNHFKNQYSKIIN